MSSKLHAELQIAWDYYPRIPHFMEVWLLRCLEEILGDSGLSLVWLVSGPDPSGKCGFLCWGNRAGLKGGGILSLGEGSSKVNHSSAWPLGRVLSRNSAAWPRRQKFVTWESWCLVKSSAVRLQRSWGADILLAKLSLRGGPSTRPFCKPLKKCIQAV